MELKEHHIQAEQEVLHFMHMTGFYGIFDSEAGSENGGRGGINYRRRHIND